MSQSNSTTVPPVQTSGAQVPGVDPVNAAIDGLVTTFIEYGLILVSVATIVMAFLELLKAATLARLWFHQWRVRTWIKRSARKEKVEATYRQLMALAASDVRWNNGLFDQSTDKMMGQVQAAANVAMDFPTTYSALFEFLTHPPEAPAPKEERERSPSAATRDPTATDQQLWSAFAGRMQDDPEVMANAAVKSEGPTAESIAANNARARLDHFVARKLDAFQSSAEYLWARLNQLVAVLGSAIVLWFVLADVAPDTGKRLALAFFGGMIAPFAKDFVSALQRLRG